MAKNKKDKRGGKRPGAGRPKTPSAAHTATLYVRCTPEDKARIEAYARDWEIPLNEAALRLIRGGINRHNDSTNAPR